MATVSLKPPAPLPESPPGVIESPKPARPAHRRPRWRSAVPWMAAFLIVGAAAGGLWRHYAQPLTVRAASVQRNLPEEVFGLGTVGADVQSAVGFKVAGVINEIDANEGDHVKTGQVLAQLDARDVMAQLAVDKAAVEQAKAAISKADADVTNAQASLTNAIAVARRRQAL